MVQAFHANIIFPNKQEQVGTLCYFENKTIFRGENIFQSLQDFWELYLYGF